ncbi:MAG TPA: recombinase family protein [Pedobacter sp.]|jgi:DNA invertase Pin-like site-specific DNA recombinase
MKIADLYIRVSTDEQADTGFSQRDQEERLRKYCDINSIKTRRIIFEDHSAKTFNRPEWTKLLTELKKQKKESTDLILFTKWDRFSRNAGDAYQMINTLRKLGIEPQAVEQPLDLAIPENKIMLAFYLAAPEVENDRRALNVIYGMRRARKEGRWMGMALPGYVNKTNEQGQKYIAISEPQASHMKWAFEQIAQGIYATEQIWSMARAKGLKCSRNSFWAAIRNPCYCGKVIVPKFKDEEMFVVQGQHEPLISERLFSDVQDVLDGRKKIFNTKIVSHDNLPLRGYLQCTKCNRLLTGSASKGRNGYHYYYHCRSACGVRFSANAVNGYFLKELKKFVPKPGIAELYKEIITDVYKDETKFYQNERKKYISELTEQSNKITKARELLLTDAIDSNDFKIIKTECESKIEKIEAKLKDFSKESSKNLDVESILEKAIHNLENLVYIYENGNIEEKRMIIGSTYAEKWTFDGTGHRTAKVNSAMELIYLFNKQLEQKKAGVKSKNSIYSGKVPSAGVF